MHQTTKELCGPLTIYMLEMVIYCILSENMCSWVLMCILLSYYGLLTREPFSYSVVWVGIVPEPVGKGTIYLPRQHYRRTVPEGEVHNKFST